LKSAIAAKAIRYVSLPIDENVLKETIASIGPVAVGKICVDLFCFFLQYFSKFKNITHL
jgi:hypothetical protein